MVAALLGTSALLAVPASAQLQATVSTLAASTSGRYQAVLDAAAATTFPAAPLVVTIPVRDSTSVYLKAVDIGTLPLSGAYYGMTTVSGTATAVLQTCTGTWSTATTGLDSACSTGVAGIATVPTTGTVLSTHPPLVATPAGKHLRLRVTGTDNKTATQLRLEVRIERPQVRAASTTSS